MSSGLHMYVHACAFVPAHASASTHTHTQPQRLSHSHDRTYTPSGLLEGCYQDFNGGPVLVKDGKQQHGFVVSIESLIIKGCAPPSQDPLLPLVCSQLRGPVATHQSGSSMNLKNGSMFLDETRTHMNLEIAKHPYSAQRPKDLPEWMQISLHFI